MGKVREVIGLILLFMGLMGVALPIIPGIPFLLAAVAVLGPSHPRLRPWLERLRRWVPLGKERGAQHS